MTVTLVHLLARAETIDLVRLCNNNNNYYYYCRIAQSEAIYFAIRYRTVDELLLFFGVKLQVSFE